MSTSTTTTVLAPTTSISESPFSCTSSGSLEIESYVWKAGEIRNLEYVIDNSRAGERLGPSSTPVQLEVESVDSTGTVFRWVTGSTDLSQVVTSPEVAEELADLMKDSPLRTLRYRVDQFGLFAGIEDPEEFRADLRAMFELLNDLAPGENYDNVATAFESASVETLNAQFTRTQQLFHATDGALFLLGGSVTGADLLPNAFGGMPMPATTSFDVGLEPDNDGCIQVLIVTTPDKNTFADIVLESAAEFFDIDPGQTTEAEMEEIRSALDVRIEADIRIDPATGRVKSATSTRSFGAVDSPRHRVDIDRITDVTIE